MNIIKKLKLILLTAFIAGSLTMMPGCEQNNDPADELEEAGENLGEAAEEAGEKTMDAVEEAGDEIEEATD